MDSGNNDVDGMREGALPAVEELGGRRAVGSLDAEEGDGVLRFSSNNRPLEGATKPDHNTQRDKPQSSFHMSRSLCEKVEEDDLEFSSRLVSALTSSVPVTASPSNTCSSPKFAFFPSFFSRNAACSTSKQASSLESNPAVKNDTSASSQLEQRMHFTSPAPSYSSDVAPHSPNISYKQPSISTLQPAAISYSSTPSTLLSGTATSSSFSSEVTSAAKRSLSTPFQPEQKSHSAVSVPSSFLGRTGTISSDTLLQTVLHTQRPSPGFSTLQHGSTYSPASSVSPSGSVSSSSFFLSRPQSNISRQSPHFATLEGARFIHPHSKPSSLERISSQPFRVFDFRSGNIHSSAANNERPSVSEKSSKSVTLPLLLEKSQHSDVVCVTNTEGGAIKAEMPANRTSNEAPEACSLEVAPNSVLPAKPSVTQLSAQTTNERLQQHEVHLTNKAEPTFSSKKVAQVNGGPVLQQVVNAEMVKVDVGTASDEIRAKSKQKDATEEMEHGAVEEHKTEMYGKGRKETDMVVEEIVKVMEEEVEFKDEDVKMNLENELEVEIDETATENVVYTRSPEPTFSFGNPLTGLSAQTGPSMMNEPQSQLTAVPSLYATSPCNAALLPSPEQHEQQTQYAIPMQQLTDCADKNESLGQHQRITKELSMPSALSQVGSKKEDAPQAEPNWKGVAILTIGPPDEAAKEEAQRAGEQREKEGLHDVATSECVAEDCSVMVESWKKADGNQERAALVNDRFAVGTHLLDDECKVGHSEGEQTLLQLELHASPARDKVKDSTPKITPSSPPSSPSSPLAISASPSAPSTTLFSSSPSLSSISSPASSSSSSCSSHSSSFSSPSSHPSSVAPIAASVSSSASPISFLPSPTSDVVDACPTTNTTSLADRPTTATIPVTTEICAPLLAVEHCDPSQPFSPLMWTRKRKNFVQTETFQPEDLASSSQREEPLLIVPPIGEYKQAQEQQREQKEAEDVPQPKVEPEQYSSQPLIEDSPEPLEDYEDDFLQLLEDDSADNVQNGSEMIPGEDGETGGNESVRVPCQGSQGDGLAARLGSNGNERPVKVASSEEEEKEEKHEERKEIEQEENGQLTERVDDQEERNEVCKRLLEDGEELGEVLDEPGLMEEDTDLDEDSSQSCADEESAKQNGTSRKELANQQAPITKDCSPFSFNIAETFGHFRDHTPTSLSYLRQNHATSNNDEEMISNEEYFLPKNPPTPPDSNSSLVPEGPEGNQAFDYVLAGYNPTFSDAASLSISRRHPDDNSTIPPTNALCKWPALRKRKRVSVLHPTSVLPKQGKTGGCRLDSLETAGKSSNGQNSKRNHHHATHNDPHTPEE